MEWDRLLKLVAVGPAQRGFALESLLLGIAATDGIEHSAAYRPRGEQLDGLLELDGRYLLLEAKWVSDPVSAADVYSFRAKVEGKLVGTIGVFVAVNGFAEAVPDVLRFGKQINVILVDGDDLRLALQDAHNLKHILRAKLRRAAQHGDVFYPYQRHLDEKAF